MKKNVMILAVVLAVLMLCMALVACAGEAMPSGKYKGTFLGTGVIYDFKSSDKVDVIYTMLGVKAAPVEVGYVIEDGTITFLIDEDAEENMGSLVEVLLANMRKTLDFEMTKKGILIDGVEYEKYE